MILSVLQACQAPMVELISDRSDHPLVTVTNLKTKYVQHCDRFVVMQRRVDDLVNPVHQPGKQLRE